MLPGVLTGYSPRPDSPGVQDKMPCFSSLTDPSQPLNYRVPFQLTKPVSGRGTCPVPRYIPAAQSR